MQKCSRHLQRTQSTAVRGELRRYPVGTDVAANFIDYTDCIENAKESSLLHKALKQTKYHRVKQWKHKNMDESPKCDAKCPGNNR